VESGQHLRASQVHVRRGRKIANRQAQTGAHLGHAFHNRLAHIIGVEIKQARFGAEEKRSRNRFVIWMARYVRESARSRNAAQKSHVRARSAAQKLHKRNYRADENTAQKS
jgi:hypothetical protein